MLSGETRPMLPERHPLALRRYRLPTPAIAQMCGLIEHCLFLYTTGAAIYGRPRFGKSYAIDYARGELAQRWPQMSVYRVLCTRSQAPSEHGFFSNLLSAVGHSASLNGSCTQLRARLSSKIREVAERRGDHRVVLFADEAQRMREIEFEWLRDVHDELALSELRLFVFLVGQPQLLAQKSAFQAQGQEQIVARFMVEELPFRGIRSVDDCATCLVAYDRGQHPPNSGWTYTRFFLAQAYEAGLRLANEANTLWNAFEDAHIRAGLSGDLEIPMKYFTAAIEGVLLRSMADDSPGFRFSEALWAQAVERSGYVKAQRAASVPITVAAG